MNTRLHDKENEYSSNRLGIREYRVTNYSVRFAQRYCVVLIVLPSVMTEL